MSESALLPPPQAANDTPMANAAATAADLIRQNAVLNAINDPFLPSHALPGPNEVSATVTLEQPREGGHVGFVTGSLPGRLDWLAQRVISFFGQNR